MGTIDRRTLLATILPGAVATAAGVTAITAAGVNFASAADALPPLTLDEIDALKRGDLAEKAGLEVGARRYWYGHRRRRRSWVCWWHRGRRVCGWRYW